MTPPDLTPEQCRMGRGALNWSGRDLARMAGVAYNTISGFERGISQPRDVTLLRILELFDKHGVRFRRTPSGIVAILETVS
jgi:transcriptional regulator with XRE-family HTH domain